MTEDKEVEQSSKEEEFKPASKKSLDLSTHIEDAVLARNQRKWAFRGCGGLSILFLGVFLCELCKLFNGTLATTAYA